MSHPFTHFFTHFFTHRLKRYLQYCMRYPVWRWNARQSQQITLQSKQGIFTIHSKDNGIGKYLFCFGEYELDLTSSVINILQASGRLNANSVLLDIGANIGTTSVTIVRSNAIRKAIAIEPVSANFELLQQNVKNNSLTDRIITRQLAISDEERDVTIELSKNLHGDHRVRMQPVASNTQNTQDLFQESDRSTISVRSVTLDQLLAQASIKPSEVGLVWIDVQGHEGYAIKGGHALFTQKPPTLIEVWKYGIERSGMNIQAFCELIAGYWSTYYLWKEGQLIKHSIGELPKLLNGLAGLAFENILLMD